MQLSLNRAITSTAPASWSVSVVIRHAPVNQAGPPPEPPRRPQDAPCCVADPLLLPYDQADQRPPLGLRCAPMEYKSLPHGRPPRPLVLTDSAKETGRHGRHPLLGFAS